MKLIVLAISTILLISCSNAENKNLLFSFVENEQGIELIEDGHKVFFYQKAPVSAQTDIPNLKNRWYNHYIHPLYNLDGAVITEAQPKDDKWHPHHRGIFWGWHQIEINGKPVADSWIMNDFKYDIKSTKTSINNENAKLIIFKLNLILFQLKKHNPINK